MILKSILEEIGNMIEHIHPTNLKHEYEDEGWYIRDCVDLVA